MNLPQLSAEIHFPWVIIAIYDGLGSPIKGEVLLLNDPDYNEKVEQARCRLLKCSPTSVVRGYHST